MRTLDCDVCNNLFIHKIHLFGKPRTFITFSRKLQLTESKAFAKSIFTKIVPLAKLDICSKISRVAIKFLEMCWSLMKAVCCYEIRDGKDFLSRFANTLVISFGMIFIMLVGLKSPMVSTLSFFSIITTLAMFDKWKLPSWLKNSPKIITISNFSRSQYFLTNSCGMPLGYATLLLPNCLIALCISASVKGCSRWLKSTCEMHRTLRSISSTTSVWLIVSLRWSRNAVLIKPESIKFVSETTKFATLFFLALADAEEWKSRVFLSPCVNQLHLSLYLSHSLSL